MTERDWPRRLHRLNRVAWVAVALLGVAAAARLASLDVPRWWVPLLIGPAYLVGEAAAWLLLRRARRARRD